jgi:GT2 family glycosyltransferase
MALTHLLAEDLLAENTYVALLDDDDTWEPEYLERCITLAASQNLDWVITGITRHESEHGPGTKLSIPQALTPSMFFATNPHVQGSNFFIRLSTLLKAGCFDENLQSTTDRDLCVRVLNLGDIKIGFVREYLVHHMAFAGNRLSTPDSPAKHQGLIAFYGKYAPLMLTKERSAFLDRATSVFSCPRSDFESGDKR